MPFFASLVYGPASLGDQKNFPVVFAYRDQFPDREFVYSFSSVVTNGKTSCQISREMGACKGSSRRAAATELLRP